MPYGRFLHPEHRASIVKIRGRPERLGLGPEADLLVIGTMSLLSHSGARPPSDDAIMTVTGEKTSGKTSGQKRAELDEWGQL